MSMKHIDLFSGIGGFSLAAKWAGFETIAHCEIEPFCRAVLAKNFPNVSICEDVNEFTAWFVRRFRRIFVHVLTAGFPCQDLSNTGRGAGIEGERSGLWFVALGVIRAIRPWFVVAENVPGIFDRAGLDGDTAIETVCAGLREEGYAVEVFVLGANSAGAPHERKRVFIVAERSDLGDSCGGGFEGRAWGRAGAISANGYAESEKFCGGEGLDKPGMGRDADGVSARLDGCRYVFPSGKGQEQNRAEPSHLTEGVVLREERLHALGNALMPQQVYPILRAIAVRTAAPQQSEQAGVPSSRGGQNG